MGKGSCGYDPTTDPFRRDYSKLTKAKTNSSRRLHSYFNRLNDYGRSNPLSKQAKRRENAKSYKLSQMTQIVADPSLCLAPDAAAGVRSLS
jgi:hypothetical protein